MGIIIAVAISSIIAGAATTAIFQVFTGNTRTSNHMTAVKQVQNAGYWISHDTQMAQSVEPTADPDGFPLTLTWTEYVAPYKEHRVVYTLLADKKLQRSYSVNGGTAETAIIAQFINPTTKCELTGGGTFTLPDSGNAFRITGGAVADSGTLRVTSGSVVATPAGGARVAGGASSKTITPASGAVTWTTPAAGGTIDVSRSGTSTAAGTWTSTAASATAAITADANGNATMTGGVLTFTVTATVGKQSETRVYEVIPRPG